MPHFGRCHDHCRVQDDSAVIEFLDNELSVFDPKPGKGYSPTTVDVHHDAPQGASLRLAFPFTLADHMPPLYDSRRRHRVEKTDTTPNDYIESLPAETHADVARLDAAISKIMGGHPKTMWEGKFWGGSEQQIIGYGDYSYERSDGKTVEWFIVGLAQQKQYISVYVNAVDEDGYLTEKYADRLGKAKVGKSSISFRSLDDIHLDVLLDLVTKAEEQMSHPG
jgi:hypothetical protein